LSSTACEGRALFPKKILTLKIQNYENIHQDYGEGCSKGTFFSLGDCSIQYSDSFIFYWTDVPRWLDGNLV
jgi:hypothetical protein